MAGLVTLAGKIKERMREGPGRQGRIEEDPAYLESLEIEMRLEALRERVMVVDEMRVKELEEEERRGERIYEVIA